MVPELVEEVDLHDQLDTSQDVFDSASPVYLTTTEDTYTLPEEEPQTVLWTNNPLDDDSGLDEEEEDEGDYDQDEDQEYDDEEDDRDGSCDDEENDSPDPTDEEDLASAVGDIFEQGYLKAMEEQNIDLEDGVSEAQREVFLTTWKGARSFKGKGSSRGRTPKREGRKPKRDKTPRRPQTPRSGRSDSERSVNPRKGTRRATPKKGPRRGMSTSRGYHPIGASTFTSGKGGKMMTESLLTLATSRISVISVRT